MLHRDLTFASLTTLKHAVMVYRSRSAQTLYVSTPFLPGATRPTFTQALLSQMIFAYKEAFDRDALRGSADGGDGDEDDEGNDVEHARGTRGRGRGAPRGPRGRGRGAPRGPRGRGRGAPRGGRGTGGSRGGAPPRGTHREVKESESGPSKRPRGEPPSDYDKITVATLSTMKQLALAKVSLSIIWIFNISSELHCTVD